jgi:hypothetical protein
MKGLDMNAEQARMGLLGINLVVGVLFLLAPKLSMRLYGVSPDDNPAAPYPVRYVGARSLLIAALLANDRSKDALLEQIPLVAAADGLANAAAGLTGEVPKRALVGGFVTSAIAAVLGLKARNG